MQRQGKKALEDLTIIYLIIIALFLLDYLTGFFKIFLDWFQLLKRVEAYFGFFLLSALGFSIFSLRRWQDLRHEYVLLERTEKLLRDSEENFRHLITRNTDSLLVIDQQNGIIHFANPAAAILFDKPAEKLVGQPFDHPVAPGETREIRLDLPNSSEPVIAEIRTAEIKWKNQDGYLLAALRNITELANLREKLHTLSLTDELTRLYNRRGFLTLAQQQLKLANRNKKSFYIVFGDLDGLKSINDRLGHLEGDQALKDMAQIFRTAFRDSDIIARIGGDEFAVCAIDATSSDSQRLLKRLEEKINQYNRRKHAAFVLSISVGSVGYDPNNPYSVDELLVMADQAMYEEKLKKKALRNSDNPS